MSLFVFRVILASALIRSSIVTGDEVSEGRVEESVGRDRRVQEGRREGITPTSTASALMGKHECQVTELRLQNTLKPA